MKRPTTSHTTRAVLSALAAYGIFAGCAAEAESAPEPVEAQSMSHNTLTPEEQAEGWTLLFDGTSTDGWRGYGMEDFPAGGWSVEDGVLIGHAVSGNMDGGDIVSLGEFEDFEFIFDFKVGAEGNSGVFYRVQEQEEVGLWQVAPEYQVLDDPAYVAMGTMDMNTHLTGDNYDLHAAETRHLNPTGDWNTGRILVAGNHVEHWLNGRLTVAYELYSDDWERRVAASKFADEQHYARAAAGSIGLQDHGTPVWYRNLKIRPLAGQLRASATAATAGPLALFNGEDLSGWTVHGTERWYVDGGELVCESGPDMAYGYLRTDATYQDFDLTLEFKQEADGNSGVFFRSTLEDVVITGWQAEVAPPGLFTGGIYESYGRGWLIQPNSVKDYALRMGEWNAMRVRADGPHVTTWINGVRMIDLVDDQVGAGTGHIALQIHDGGGIKVRWRNLVIRRLDTQSNDP